MWKPTPGNPHHQHLPRPQGPHLAMATRMRDGRKLRGSGKGKERREGQDLEERASRPGLIKLGAGAASGAEELGAEVEELPLFPPHPFLHGFRRKEGGLGGGPPTISLSSLCHFLGFYIFSGKAWAEGRHRADSGRELGKMYAAIVYIG
jgi:hypothetical protein